MLSLTDIIMLQHGNKKEYKIIKPSKELIILGKELDKLKEGKIVLKKTTLKSAKKESEDFMKSHFNIHKILYQTPTALQDFISSRKNLSVEEMLKEYKRFGMKIDPFDLPISLVPKKCWYGKIGELGINYTTKEFLEKAPVIFYEIVLSENITNLTPRSLSHEISHT